MIALTRREVIRMYPPPYKCRLFDGKKLVEDTEHRTLSSLETEVECCAARIKGGAIDPKTGQPSKEKATHYEIDGVPRELVLPKHKARDAL